MGPNTVGAGEYSKGQHHGGAAPAPVRWWRLQPCSRSPLMRGTDRVEAVLVTLVVTVVLLLVPVCAAVGTETLLTLAATAAAMILVVPPAAAAAINTTTTVSIQGMAATTCPVTLTAQVTPAFTGGTVTFKEGNATLGAAAAVTNGTAGVQHTFSTTGAHVVVATFGGAMVGADDFKASTSGALTVTVATGLNLGSVCLPIG